MSRRLEEIKTNFEYANRYNVLGHGWENAIGDLIKQAERVEESEEELMTAHAPIGHLEQENKKLREALRFYADAENFRHQNYRLPLVDYDEGKKARQALEEANHANHQ